MVVFKKLEDKEELRFLIVSTLSGDEPDGRQGMFATKVTNFTDDHPRDIFIKPEARRGEARCIAMNEDIGMMATPIQKQQQK